MLCTHLHTVIIIMSEKLDTYCSAVIGYCFPSLQDGKFVAELKEAADVLLASLIRIMSLVGSQP